MNWRQPSRELLLALGAAACVLLYGLDRVLVEPALAAWQLRADENRALQAQLQSGRALLAEDARWQRLGQEMTASLLPVVPSDAESVLLNQSNVWANATGLRLTSLRPRWRESRDGERQLELLLSGTGKMDAILRFLHQVETARLAVAVELVELSPTRQDSPELSLNLRLSGLCRKAAKGGKS